MRWPIRNQILVPFVSVLVTAVSSTAVASAYFAARRAEADTIRQIRAVSQTLAQTNFPLTPSVLERMRGLSGAHFVVRERSGRVVQSTLPNLMLLPAPLARDSRERNFDAPARHASLTIGGRAFLATEVAVPSPTGSASLVVLFPEATWQQARWDAATPPLAIGLAALAVLIVVAYWLAEHISRPIRRIEQQVSAIANGNFQVIESEPRGDELRELVGSVNRMATQLRDLHETIRRTERSHVLGQVAGGLAHQLRNAITGARLAAQIHQRRCPADPLDQSLAVSLQQLTLTEQQVAGLLALHQPRASPFVSCDLCKVLDEVALLVGPACQHAHVDFCNSHDFAPTWVAGRPDDLRAAILNLTLNAIEAAGPSGSVRLELTCSGTDARVVVRDTGPGPPPELADRLFEPFVTGKPEGIGLGLALAQQAAIEHHGTLNWSRDKAETTFSMTVPLQVPTANPDAEPAVACGPRANCATDSGAARTRAARAADCNRSSNPQ